jgi:glycosyltransferase involved in cell wall biosynthesis
VKVTYIIDSLRRHGTQRFLVHLTGGLKQLGYDQQVIELSGNVDQDIEEALAASCREVLHIGKRSLLFFGAGWFRLVRILRRFKPDLVMTLLPVSDSLGRPAARLSRAPVLLSSIRARDLDKPAWQRLWDRRTVSWARKIIFNSAHVVEFAQKKEGIRDEQVVVIPNGVADLRACGSSFRAATRRELSVESGVILLGAVGRLQRQKNHTLLLRACAKLLSSAQDWRLLVVGDGPDRGKLQSLAGELGIGSRVIWLGSRTDPVPFLAAMDIFVHTADYEGMPNALMEAMAMALPAVASRVDGAIELIRDGISGYLVPAGDASAFADRISRIMSDSNLAARLGENAHREILETLGMERMIDAYHQLFTSVVGRGSA